MASQLDFGPRYFRFRMDRAPDDPGGQRRWKARYSYAGGWAPFDITVDFERCTCTFHKAPGVPYGGLLCDLVETLIDVETASVPLVRQPTGTLAFPCEFVGYSMSRQADAGGGVPAANGPAACFRDFPQGSWLVLRALMPTGGSFLLAINDRVGSGEIVSRCPEDGLSVIGAMADVFADARAQSRTYERLDLD